MAHFYLVSKSKKNWVSSLNTYMQYILSWTYTFEKLISFISNPILFDFFPNSSIFETITASRFTLSSDSFPEEKL